MPFGEFNNTTWKLNPAAGAMGLGPGLASLAWWSNSAADVAARGWWGNTIVFNADGSFQNVMGTETWLDTWQGVGSAQNGTPISPHDGSNAATWSYDSDAGTITLTGEGAHVGNPRVHNTGELASPNDAPEAITYEVRDAGTGVGGAEGAEAIYFDINFGHGYWRFTYIKVAAAPTTPTFATKAELQVAVNAWCNGDTTTNPNIGSWNTSAITDMSNLFQGKTAFNDDISDWNTSNVTNMTYMFFGCTAFNNGDAAGVSNKPLTWDTAKVTAMPVMFYGCTNFIQEIRSWDVPLVGDYSDMFRNANAFKTRYSISNTPQHFFFVIPQVGIPICFPKDTPVLTNLGPVAIEKLNPDQHTICGKEIVAITQTQPLQKHIVCFEENSLGNNIPSQKTLCSKEHKISYQGEMTKARDLVDLCENVTFIPYNGETLYNVLLKQHDTMMINNMVCETLHPENIAAKISTMKDCQKKGKIICELNKIIKENNILEYQKLYASL